MSTGKLSRRKFVRTAGTLTGGLLLGACAQQIQPTVAPTTAAVAQPTKPPTSAPTPVPTKPAPVRGGTLTVVSPDPAAKLDPAQYKSYSDVAILYCVTNRLVRVNSDLQIVPDLAESWEVSDDKLKWTFHLRKGVKFQDGTPFNSGAIQAQFARLRDPELAFSSTARLPEITSIETPDEYTVVFGTDSPFGPFLNYISHMSKCILSPASIEKDGPRSPDTNPVGSGPYRVAEFAPAMSITLEPFDECWSGKPSLDKLVLIPAPEPAARANLLRTGEADVADQIPIAELESLDADPNITVIRKKSLYAFGTCFNFDIPPFDDIRVRQAFNYAVDKNAIVEHIFGGAAAVLDSPLATPIVGHKSCKAYEYDPDKAKALLAEAGWIDHDGDGILDKDGKPLRPTLVFRDVLNLGEVYVAVQGDLKKIGVDVQLQELEAAAWGPAVLAARGENKAELMSTSFNPSNGDATYQMNYMFLSNPDPQGQPPYANWGWYNDPEVDRLIKETWLETDQTKRGVALGQVQELLMEAAPWIWLYAPDQIIGVRNNVRGVDVFPMRILDLVNASVV